LAQGSGLWASARGAQMNLSVVSGCHALWQALVRSRACSGRLMVFNVVSRNPSRSGSSELLEEPRPA